MTALQIIQAMQLVNGLVVEGKKLAVTINGEDATEEMLATIDAAVLQVALNRDND